MDYIILSAFGTDRPGIVSHLTGTITSHGGNIEESRMVKLGTDFTTMILVSVSNQWTESLIVALEGIQEQTNVELEAAKRSERTRGLVGKMFSDSLTLTKDHEKRIEEKKKQYEARKERLISNQ